MFELRQAKRNEAWARDQGAVEVGAGHYPIFFVLHTSWLLAWPLEAWLGGPQLAATWPIWLALFGAAEGLRYWAIASLGQRWNTRILVLPGRAPIRSGPYRVVPHPNYIAVIVELAALPLLFGAWRTAARAPGRAARQPAGLTRQQASRAGTYTTATTGSANPA
ncbi:MAG: isoprenylcysteine carboxylmethyltransferase family protein [Myxococcota bacterium]